VTGKAVELAVRVRRAPGANEGQQLGIVGIEYTKRGRANSKVSAMGKQGQ
jgi:hypothetical protein